jgi:hypothetical protein
MNSHQKWTAGASAFAAVRALASNAIHTVALVCASWSADLAAAQSYDGLPQLQISFLKVIDDARQTYANGQTDLQKGAARPARARALCALLAGQRIAGWVGTVADLRTNNEGRGVISIDVGQRTYLMRHNNAFSDYGHETMLDPESPLFAVATSLKKGDKVAFSVSVPS